MTQIWKILAQLSHEDKHKTHQISDDPSEDELKLLKDEQIMEHLGYSPYQNFEEDRNDQSM